MPMRQFEIEYPASYRRSALCAITTVMNAEEYKSSINRTHVLDHTTLDITLKELSSRQEFELAENIQRILQKNKLPKPELQSKFYDNSTSYYKVDLSSDSVKKIIDIFFDLEGSHVGKKGETTPTASFYASLVDKSNKLANR